MSRRLVSLAALPLLLAATPVLAQSEATALRGLSEVRLALGVQSPDAARAHCQLPQGLEADLYETLRATAEGLGLRVPTGTRDAQLGPGHLMVAGTPSTNQQPLLFANFGVVARPDQPGSPCGASLIMQVRARVTGQVTATGGRLDTPVTLWHDDAAGMAPPGEALPVMRAQLRAMMERFAGVLRTNAQASAPQGTTTKRKSPQ
ncbi:hypothetical protein [Sabulicella glaciei]|uniref:DUF4410 domain-containing protein n=1 Tax=Sabulicella glaciei TaxID=2984948 RepID=A0ABT3NSL8_9PROT|nr:hypothetical protein [Roseococcus sp. MDT2-1-1]MCW8085154.1 hypothetical protein [Roseococcus sp. MDT2-1-1]